MDLEKIAGIFPWSMGDIGADSESDQMLVSVSSRADLTST